MNNGPEFRQPVSLAEALEEYQSAVEASQPHLARHTEHAAVIANLQLTVEMFRKQWKSTKSTKSRALCELHASHVLAAIAALTSLNNGE